jgi:hypothetical protein
VAVNDKASKGTGASNDLLAKMKRGAKLAMSGDSFDVTEISGFYENHKQDFLAILDIPLIAVCKENHELVPYEYSDRQFRYRRQEEEVDRCLSEEAPGLAVYCVRFKIPKQLLQTIAGGNLYSYDRMKKSYANRAS